LVYAGAIMVLFVFVIMLLNLAELPRTQNADWRKIMGFVGGIGLTAVLLGAVTSAMNVVPTAVSVEMAAINGSAANLAEVLFTQYALLVEVVGLLLLVATIGAVMLAKRRFA
jgi:NADH-quinone oxidoreductase subunit J